MLLQTFRIPYAGRDIFVRRWAPEGAPRAAVQIAHGLSEHSARYERFANALTAENYVVYANDHRGHGPECPPEDLAFFADRDGWRACLDDLAAVAAKIGEREGNIPRVFSAIRWARSSARLSSPSTGKASKQLCFKAQLL